MAMRMKAVLAAGGIAGSLALIAARFYLRYEGSIDLLRNDFVRAHAAQEGDEAGKPQAGMAKEEADLLLLLAARRSELEEREAGLRKQSLEVAAVKEALERRMETFEKMRREWLPLIAQLKDKRDREIGDLVKICETMSAKKAAERLNLIDVVTLGGIMRRMSKKRAAAVMEQMKQEKVRDLIYHMTHRHEKYSQPDTLVKAAAAGEKVL